MPSRLGVTVYQDRSNADDGSRPAARDATNRPGRAGEVARPPAAHSLEAGPGPGGFDPGPGRPRSAPAKARFHVAHADEDPVLAAAYRAAAEEETQALNEAVALAMAQAPTELFEAAKQRHLHARWRADEALKRVRGER
jgi:hypothetical protein